MPQMSPMWWTTIFLVTMSIMLMVMISNYFLMYKKININLKKTNKMINWKW